LLKPAVTRSFLISRCTRRAHAALQVIEELELSLQSIMDKSELAPAIDVQSDPIRDGVIPPINKRRSLDTMEK
jgi:hypothetical protein